MQRRRVFSGAEWEKKVGYCRAIMVGRHIWVSGTAPVAPQGGTFAPGDAYAQTCRCLEIVEAALVVLGTGLNDVVRTRIFVTDISRWPEIGRAHQKFFEKHPPVTTMVEVRALIAPDMLVEVEADAFRSAR